MPRKLRQKAEDYLPDCTCGAGGALPDEQCPIHKPNGFNNESTAARNGVKRGHITLKAFRAWQEKYRKPKNKYWGSIKYSYRWKL